MDVRVGCHWLSHSVSDSSFYDHDLRLGEKINRNRRRRVGVWEAVGTLSTDNSRRDESVAGSGYVRMFTARAITSPRTASEPNACTVIASLAHRASGMTSVGLNAVAFVKPR
jgi:hypothetical protein